MLKRMRKRIPLIRRPSWTFSKTQIFGVALIIFGALQANMEVFSPFLNEKSVGYLTTVIGIIVYILRALTTTSLTEKILEKRIETPNTEVLPDNVTNMDVPDDPDKQ